PLFTQIFRFDSGEGGAGAPQVEMVRIAAADWDASLAEAERRSEVEMHAERPAREVRKEAEPDDEELRKKEPEKAPGQVVDVAPGKDEEISEGAEDSRFVAESTNR